MPNWCSTSIAIFGKQENVEEMYERLEKMSKKESRVENGFGKLWEGNLLDSYGIYWETVCCRGNIDDFALHTDSDGNKYLRLNQTDAWEPNIEYLEKIFEKAKYDLDCVYIAEEPGCQIFENSDSTGKYFPEMYKVEFECAEDIPILGLEENQYVCEYYEDEQQVLELFQTELWKADSFDELKEKYEKHREKFNWLEMIKFDFV